MRNGRPQSHTKPYTLHTKPSLSPLTARILAVNLLPLVLLVGTILYLGGYQDRLIHNELDSMRKEARQFAAALGEGAVIIGDDERDLLAPELARLMLRRLMETTETRTRLYDVHGGLFADSLYFPGLRNIQHEPLPPPGSLPAFDWKKFWGGIETWLQQRSWSETYPPYVERRQGNAVDYPIVDHALDGDEGGQVWLMQDGHIMLSVAVPVQRYKGVLGAVFLTRPGTKIEEAVEAVRFDIIRLFAFTLVITILLSLYLARAIARPLQDLSKAAEGLKAGRGATALKWQTEIPDLSARGDEIGELSAALRAMVKALGERMHAIESFAADVAHEIKNPLTSLHSAAETALRLSDPVSQRKLLDVMAADVKRLDRLITDISQASRLEGQLSRASTKPIYLAAMLQAITSLYTDHEDVIGARSQNRPHFTLNTEGQEDLRISGADSRLAEVFQNLIDNAISFSPEGGTVRLALTKRVSTIEEDKKTEKPAKRSFFKRTQETPKANRKQIPVSYARVTIEDSGPGLPENKLEAVFERFYSERPSHEAFGQHSGLGLSIARQIVEAHRGRLWAENIHNTDNRITGARFVVELPIVEEEEKMGEK
jgi:two-component system sensor histidine kinase ChvG